MRGEYTGLVLVDVLTKELPPRARRIPAVDGRGGHESGTTSACAENTKLQPGAKRYGGTTSACAENTAQGLTSPPWKRNYLRVRGEYSRAVSRAARATELPPRARRILVQVVSLFAVDGTTSACAENTRR